MPPQLAFFLCLSFVLFLYYVDFKLFPKVSYTIWLPIFWILINSSRPVSSWFTTNSVVLSPETYLQGSPIDRTIYLILIIFSFIVLLRRSVNFTSIVKNNPIFFFFIAYCALSIFWSDFQYVSFKRWIKSCLGNTLIALIILSDDNPIETFKAVFRRITYVLIPFSILLIKYFPDYGRSYDLAGVQSFVGVATQKNSLGWLCMITSIFYIWEIFINKGHVSFYKSKSVLILNISVFILITWTLHMSQSMTSNLGLLIGIVIFILLKTSLVKNNLNYLSFFIVLLISSILLMQYFFNIYEEILFTTGKDLTLTGRTLLWQEVLNIKINSIIGTGWDSFWLGERLEYLWSLYWWQPNQAHNGYIEIYINLGIIGLTLFLFLVISIYYQNKQLLLLQPALGVLFLTYFFVTLISNITEATFKGMHLLWFLFIFISIGTKFWKNSSQSHKD